MVWPHQGHSPIELEHRLTVLEEQVPQLWGAIRDLRSHATEAALWTPRDYMTAATGIAMVLAALFGKSDWVGLLASLPSAP